jgi:hypothetical protein
MDATRTAPELGTAVSPPAATWKGGATASDVDAGVHCPHLHAEEDGTGSRRQFEPGADGQGERRERDGHRTRWKRWERSDEAHRERTDGARRRSGRWAGRRAVSGRGRRPAQEAGTDRKRPQDGEGHRGQPPAVPRRPCCRRASLAHGCPQCSDLPIADNTIHYPPEYGQSGAGTGRENEARSWQPIPKRLLSASGASQTSPAFWAW